VGNEIGLGNRPPLSETAAVLGSLVVIFVPELAEGEEDGVATATLVLGVAAAEVLVDVDEPPPSPPPPKTNPKSTASSGGDTLALNVGEPGGVVDVVCANGVRGEWKWM
jgi:hypothetical protein